MHPNISASRRLFFLITTFILIHVPTLLCIDDEHYGNCSKPFQCANMQNIGYPFWGDNRPDYCGHPGFQLDCKGDAPEITIMSARFRVLGINNLLQILAVARADYWNNICPTVLFNTTLNFTLFNYTSDTQNVTVYYDCPIVPFELPVKGLSNDFNCTVNNTNTLSYFVTRNVTNFPSLIRERLASCSDNVTVQVLHSEAVAMENDLTSASLTAALNGGFALQWVANDSLCYQCKGTGGQCGHNSSLNEFTCYCSDQPYARECPVTPDSVRYETCSKPFQCTNIPNIGYPFWGHSRPEYCGYPGFELDCNGDAPEITIMSRRYRVLDINKALQILNVARADYWNNICPTYFFNTTLNSTPFDYTPNTQNVTQYFCCPAKMFDLPVEGLSSYFDCSTNNTIICSCYMTRDITDFSPTVSDLFESCSERVTIQVFRSEALADESNLTSADLAAALSGGFGLQWTANDTLCDQCKRTGGQCGYNNTLYEFICYCPNQSYARECPAAPGSFFKRNEWIKIVIGIVAGVVGITVIVVICRKYLSYKAMAFWKKETKDDDKVKEFIRNHESLAPKRYKYSKVKKITNSFADELGKGGFGVVYKGRLSYGRLVAVKVLNQSKGNGEDFINEVASISRTSHVNVVSLLGFCHERTNRALIYEFMSNGSLDKCIYDQGRSNANRHLEWNTLYQIAVGIGRGLEYLHRGCNTRILHFDIKPHNILLDENFCPKISDFGLAILCQSGESTVSMQNGRGTPGYAAPELLRTNIGKVSYKSDVYSYGMMVLEMVGGRKNFDVGVAHSSEMYFPHWIHNHLEQGQDLRLGGVMTNEEEELARKMILVSLWCIQTLPSDRPSMTEVVEKLEGSLQSLEIPPKPYPSSPARPSQHSSSSSSSSSS